MVMGSAGTEERGWTCWFQGMCSLAQDFIRGVHAPGTTCHINGPPCGHRLVAADLTVGLVNPIDCEEVNC